MTSSKDPSIKRLFGQVKAAVDAHATDSTMLKDLSTTKVAQIEVKKKEGDAKLKAEALNDL
jgi:hypothetical protein